MFRRATLLLLLAGLAQAQLANLAIEHFVLPNGLEVILHVDRKAPVVYLNFRFRVGSKNEAPGKTGLAHLFEHLLFQGRDTSSEFQPVAESIGATGINGETNPDFTEYYETVPASRLERMLWLESNRFALFQQNLTQEQLDLQRSVVINEKRQKTENEPYGAVDTLMVENSFPTGHPYQHSALGSYPDLRAITLDDARAFYAANYTPNQLTLALAGDLDPGQVRQWILKYFGSMAPSTGVVSPPRSAPPMSAPKVVDVVDRVRVERVWFYWPAPPMSHREEAALEFAAFLFSDDATHLFKALTDELSLGVSLGLQEYRDASLFSVIVSLAPGATLAAVEEKLAPEIARMAREGPTSAQMEKARNGLESNQTAALETLAGIATAMQRVRHFYGNIDQWAAWTQRYRSVTSDDVRAAVARWLNTPNHLTIHVHPDTSETVATPEPDRTQPPPFQPEKPYHPPTVSSAQLPNGLTIFVVERHDLPKVAIEVRFKVGALQNPPGKPGVALLTAATAGKATSTRDAESLERERVNLAATLHGNADLNTLACGIEVLRRNLVPAFRLLADIVLNASYPDDAVQALKKDWLDDLEKPEGADIGNFERPLLEVAFGPGHPIGDGRIGTPAAFRSVTPQDIRDFHSRYWKPDVAAVVFAGDITLKEALALSTEVLGNWSGSAAALVTATVPPPAPKPGGIFLLNREGATQTMVVQVVPGIPRESPDYPALLLADRVFGGISGSRLSRNIRQQKGIAYYATSELSNYPGSGIWAAFSPVQVDQTGVAMREFQNELRALAAGSPVTPAELEAAKSSIIRALPDQYERLWDIAESVTRNWAWGFPPSELQSFPERLSALTVDEVNVAARKYAKADRAVFLLLGDREKIEPQLRTLGLGQIVVLK